MKRALRLRSELLFETRVFFRERGFIEVETPIRVRAPANEAHIDAEPSGDRWLRTSPELHMKRLLAEGFDKIFQLGPCFRRSERGERHHPEFTMLEWYRARADYRDIVDDARELIAHLARAAAAFDGRSNPYEILYQGSPVLLYPEWTWMTVRDSFRRWAGWDPTVVWEEDRFHMDLVEKVEPALPRDRPVILADYPLHAGAFARQKPDDPSVAERWELYIAGLELANAYSELIDPQEQRKRFEDAVKVRRNCGKEIYPIDEEFVAALALLPPCGGIALGFDRLVMLFVDASTLDDILPFRND